MKVRPVLYVLEYDTEEATGEVLPFCDNICRLAFLRDTTDDRKKSAAYDDDVLADAVCTFCGSPCYPHGKD